MSQEIGYARVSKTEQHFALQLDALKRRGVVRVFTDKQTGIRFDLKEFLAAIDYLNEGDTLVVWKLDRLGRSLQQLIKTLERLKKRNIHLVSLTEDVNTSTPHRHAVFPTGCATCMTFRHRHPRRGRLIETTEIEPGKAETGEKKAVCEEDACAIRRKGCPHNRLLLVPLYLSPAGRQQPSRTLLECRASA